MKFPTFTLRGFRQPREVLEEPLGKLEGRVMEFVWQQREVSVREVYLAFDEEFAYTTLMTTFDRLYRKGLLERRREGRAFIYAPRFSAEQFERSLARDLIDTLLGRDAHGVEPVLACIVEAVSDRDRALLDELDRLIKEKRRTLTEED